MSFRIRVYYTCNSTNYEEKTVIFASFVNYWLLASELDYVTVNLHGHKLKPKFMFSSEMDGCYHLYFLQDW